MTAWGRRDSRAGVFWAFVFNADLGIVDLTSFASKAKLVG
jgi:hypothetical protein